MIGTAPARPTGTRVVERTLAWIARHRSCVRDYERLPAHHEAMVRWSMIRITSRRLIEPA
jgi:transposase